MKKYLYGLIVVYIMSFVFIIGNYKADNAAIFATPLKTLRGSTLQKTMQKTDLDYQVIEFGYVQSNRAIQFKMNTSSFYDFSALPEGNAFEIHAGRLAEAITRYTGEKTLYLRTKKTIVGTTALSGTWFMAKADFQRAYPNYTGNVIIEN